MLETLFNVTNDGTVTAGTIFSAMIAALILGFIIAGTYAFIMKKENASVSFFMTLVLLPALVSLIIVLISGDAAKALSIAGVFTLVRFRSQPGDGRDLSFILLAMAAGLATGMHYMTVAAVLVLVACVIIVLIAKIAENFFKTETKSLKIVIPEDMNYSDAFTDIFNKYTVSNNLEKVKTTNMGTLYELSYIVKMKKEADEKGFLDEIRVRNGNLNITLSKLIKKETQL